MSIGKSSWANEDRFTGAVDYFLNLISQNSPGGRPFTGFREGIIFVEEGYKERLHAIARKRLAAETWSAEDIGTGKLLSAVISAIEVNQPEARNNLLEWEGRNGPQSTDHRALIAAQPSQALRQNAEKALFAIYCGPDDDEASFDRCVQLFGRVYPLLGYLWFLKDSHRFIPVRPTGLQQGLDRSGIDLRLIGRCSWRNYKELIAALEELRKKLAFALGLPEVTLLEAHSFLWVVGSWTALPQGSSSRGYSYGEFERAAYILAKRIESTVTYANDQLVDRRVKAKETDMKFEELNNYIAKLLRDNKGRCAVTGLQMLLPPDKSDPDMAASPDRIDSDLGYVQGNIQMVCWFVNRWKGTDSAANFLRLVNAIRSAPMRESS